MDNKKSVGYRIGEMLGTLLIAFLISIIIILFIVLMRNLSNFIIGLLGISFTLPFYIVLFGIWILLLKTWK